jgi:hypothetical protein
MAYGGRRDERQRYPELQEFAARHTDDANNPCL